MCTYTLRICGSNLLLVLTKDLRYNRARGFNNLFPEQLPMVFKVAVPR